MMVVGALVGVAVAATAVCTRPRGGGSSADVRKIETQSPGGAAQTGGRDLLSPRVQWQRRVVPQRELSATDPGYDPIALLKQDDMT